MRIREYQARGWLEKDFVLLMSRQKFNGHFANIFGKEISSKILLIFR